MISEQFERLICQGKAEHVIFNVGDGIVNYNVGRGKFAIIESITAQPMQQELGGSGNTLNRFRALMENRGIFTVNAYNNETSKSVTIKNSFAPTIDRSETSLNTYAISTMRQSFDVFWLFKSENITIEIPDLLNSIAVTQVEGTAQANLPTREIKNPLGYSGLTPSSIAYSGGAFNWNINLLGRQSGINLPGITQDNFIVPKIGDGVTGNSIKRGRLLDANFQQPIINVGIIEFDCDCLNF